jgi:large conductance mechanosensitive channel
MWKEFKEFAVKGNAIDLAVGVVIGAAFGKIVASLVADVIMPPIGLLIGGVDFKDYFVVIKPLGAHFSTLQDAVKAKAVTINVGVFANVVIEFVIVAFAIFLMVRALNKMKKPKPNAEPVAKDCPACTMSIPVKATRCPHCTSELSAARTA